MTAWDRRDAEMAIAIKRAEINRALDHKAQYDAEQHNICLALVRFSDGTTDALAAYSNDSAIPESIRLGLNLIPDLHAAIEPSQRFGCQGMGQFHTEPKLLNYLCAAPNVRKTAVGAWLPRNPLYRSVLRRQRTHAATQAERLNHAEQLTSVTLVTEINCCPTCTKYAVNRFRSRFPNTPLELIELGKETQAKVAPQYQTVTVSTIKK